MSSTAEQRARNLAKQRRFQLRHPGYSARLAEIRKERQNLIDPKPIQPRFDYRTYELVDPRRPNLPVIVGYCRASTDIISNLWAARHYSRAKWAQWLCELEGARLKPIELRSKYSIGFY